MEPVNNFAPPSPTQGLPYAAVASLVTAYYNRIAARYEERQFLRPEDLTFLSAFVERCAHCGVTELFDFGCGTCKVTVGLAELGFHCVGADISERMIAIANTMHTHPRLQAVQASFESLLQRVPHSRRVGAIFLYSLIHLPHAECAALLQCLRTALAPKSPVLIALHYGPQGLVDSPLNGDLLPIFGWERAAFAQVLSSAGFQIIRQQERAPCEWEIKNTKAFLLVE